MLVCYFDMDEVVYNLSKIVVEQYNHEFNDNMNYKDNKSYWWADCKKAPKSFFEKLLYKDGLFLHGSCIDGMKELIDKLYNSGHKVHFVTAPQYEGKCFEEKVQWLKNTFEWFDPSKHFIATESKYLLAKENRILIDDNSKYLDQWDKAGGIAIGFGGFDWTLKYKGLQAKNSNELEWLIQFIKREDN